MTMGSVVVYVRKSHRSEGRPRDAPTAELRTREHLTEREVEKLIEAAKGNRWGHRDSTMILIAYRHGLRASELVDLRWDQVHFTPSLVSNYAPCAASSGSRSPRHRTCSCRSGRHRSRPRPSREC